jgi:hypothetical protein
MPGFHESGRPPGPIFASSGSSAARSVIASATSRLDVRPHLNGRTDRHAKREPARPIPSTAVTGDVCEPQLLEHGQLGAADVERDNVVD